MEKKKYGVTGRGPYSQTQVVQGEARWEVMVKLMVVLLCCRPYHPNYNIHFHFHMATPCGLYTETTSVPYSIQLLVYPLKKMRGETNNKLAMSLSIHVLECLKQCKQKK